MKLITYVVVHREINQSSLGLLPPLYLPVSYLKKLVLIISQNGGVVGPLSGYICLSLSPLESFQ